jgi:transglutaminase-like putative cysteine protease
MQRRDFLCHAGAWAGASLVGRIVLGNDPPGIQESCGPHPPAYSVVPVVGDGRWIWTAPPTETGYLEPREYDLSIGIELEGTGEATRIEATTVVPVELPEQKLEPPAIDARGCEAGVRQVGEAAGQLALAAAGIAAGERISATARYRVTLYKQYEGYTKEQFPAEQQPPKEIKKLYLGDSPGIHTRASEVRKLVASVAPEGHPWDRVEAFYHWVWENITPRPGAYTNVSTAIRERVGDCEERSAVLVALCRACGIPARLVWVPNHNWPEFCLSDAEGQPHWIPAHTSCYSWFGWTGAHELVLQKGDRIYVPQRRQPQRLAADWVQWRGARPEVRFTAEMVPLPSAEGGDAGPGHRRKDERGAWVVVGQHELDPYLRDGERAGTLPVAGG